MLIVESLLFDNVGLYLLIGPLPLAFGCLSALGRQDLLRWQDHHGLVVCTRVGAKRFAWTRSQGRARLVTTPSTTGPT